MNMVKNKILNKEAASYESVEEIPSETKSKSRMSSKRDSRSKSELGSRKA